MPSVYIISEDFLSLLAVQCSANTTCTKAVYDTTGKKCHIKDTTATLTWVANTQFNVIYINNTFAEGTIIARCPFTGTCYPYIAC